MPHDRIIVHLVEPQPLGYEFERRRLAWPLHITLVPWFSCEAIPQSRKLLSRLAEWAALQQSFTYTVGKEKQFGADQSVPVNVIADPDKLATVHDELCALVSASGGTVLTEQWIGPDYIPHISQHGDNGRRPGDQLVFNNIAVIELTTPGQCRVEAVLQIGGGYENQA